MFYLIIILYANSKAVRLSLLMHFRQEDMQVGVLCDREINLKSFDQPLIFDAFVGIWE